jgi:hypothetical protein
MPISTYIKGNLCTDVRNYLVVERSPEKYPAVQQLYRQNSNGNFFYEGTVRAQIAHFIQNNIPANETNALHWIVASEQPYEQFKWRADILVRNITAPDDYTIVIEVKSDLNLESAIDDANKMVQARSQGMRIDEAYMFFVCPATADPAKWKEKIEKAVGNGVVAIGISGS